MDFESKILVDIFEGIASRIRYKMAGVFDTDAPYFDYNTQSSMIALLTEKNAGNISKYQKYPLIYLQLPFVENYNVDRPLLYKATSTMYIFAQTKPTLYAKDRYDFTFRQTLYPIFEALIEEINLCDDFFHGVNGGFNDFEKSDLMYWGSGGSNIATDMVDAIEIRNMKLKVINKKTC